MAESDDDIQQEIGGGPSSALMSKPAFKKPEKSRRKERHDSLKKEEPEGIELKPIPPPDDSDEEDIQRDISGTGATPRFKPKAVTAPSLQQQARQSPRSADAGRKASAPAASSPAARRDDDSQSEEDVQKDFGDDPRGSTRDASKHGKHVLRADVSGEQEAMFPLEGPAAFLTREAQVGLASASGNLMAAVGLATKMAGGASSGIKLKRADMPSSAPNLRTSFDKLPHVSRDSLHPEKPKTIKLESAIKQLQETITRKKLYQELGWYMVFLVLFVVLVFLQRNLYHNYMVREVLKDTFVDEEFPEHFSFIKKNFLNIGEMAEFWQWLLGPFLEGITQKAWYNGRPYGPLELGYIRNGLRIVGAIRLRQLRVSPDSCVLSGTNSKVIKDCYWFYNQWSESHEPFGPSYNESDKYKFSHHSGRAIWGYVSPIAYGTDGFVVDLPYGSDYEAQLFQLYNDLWVDRQTRAVIVTVNAVSGNLNLFAVTTFLIEFDPAGGVWPNYEIMIFRTSLYTTPLDYFRAGVEVAVLIFILYFTVKLILEAIFAYKVNLLPEFMKDAWNLLDFLQLTLLYLGVGLNIAYLLDDRRRNIDVTRTDFINMDHVAAYHITTFYVNGFNLLLAFIRVFKFLRVNDRMSMLWKTLSRASTDLLTFAVFFVIIFFGFAFMGQLLFGTEVRQYATFDGAVTTLFRLILGDFSYDDIYAVNRVLAPIFFFLFVFLVFFTMVNMFLAIINDAYSQERDHIKNQGGKPLTYIIRNAVKRKWDALRNLGKHEQDSHEISEKVLLERLKKAAQKKQEITVDELTQIAPENANAVRKLLIKETHKKQKAQFESFTTEEAEAPKPPKPKDIVLNQRMDMLEQKLNDILRLLAEQQKM